MTPLALFAEVSPSTRERNLRIGHRLSALGIGTENFWATGACVSLPLTQLRVAWTNEEHGSDSGARGWLCLAVAEKSKGRPDWACPSSLNTREIVRASSRAGTWVPSGVGI